MKIAVPGLIDRARDGATAIIDGGEGTVILDPLPETIRAYRERHEVQLREHRTLGRLRRKVGWED